MEEVTFHINTIVHRQTDENSTYHTHGLSPIHTGKRFNCFKFTRNEKQIYSCISVNTTVCFRFDILQEYVWPKNRHLSKK